MTLINKRFKNTLSGLILILIFLGLILYIGQSTIFGNFFDYLSEITKLDTYDDLMIPFLVFIPPFTYIFLFNRLIEDISDNGLRPLCIVNSISLFISFYAFCIFIYGEAFVFQIYNIKIELFHIASFITAMLIMLLFINIKKDIYLNKVKNIELFFISIFIFLILIVMGSNIHFSNQSKEFFVILLTGMFLSILFNYIELLHIRLSKKK